MTKTAVTAVLVAACASVLARPAAKPQASAQQPRCTPATVKSAHAAPTAKLRPAAQPGVASVARNSAVPFRPTQFPHIFVRSLPAAAPGQGQGLVYIAPGGTPPQRPVSAHRSVQPTAQPVPGGGTMLLMDPDDAPTEVAHIDAAGRVNTECVPAGKARSVVKGAKQ